MARHHPPPPLTQSGLSKTITGRILNVKYYIIRAYQDISEE